MAKPTPLHDALGIDPRTATDEPLKVQSAGNSHVIITWTGMKVMTREDFAAAMQVADMKMEES